MIGQRAKGLPTAVYHEGCAMMALIYLAWREGPVGDAWTVPRICKTYEDLVLNHAMKADCLILDWQRAADEIAPGLLHYDGYQPAGGVSSLLTVAEWHFRPRGWTHFITPRRGDSESVEYDPWPASTTAREGHLVSVRGFSKVPFAGNPGGG